MPLLIIALIASLLLAYVFGKPYYIQARRRRLQRQPFPENWRQILRKRVPYFRSLPADLQLQLKKHIQVFLHEKEFIGCNGIVINDEIRVTIAAQACLLLLNRETDYYPSLSQILVYPDAFIVHKDEVDHLGLVTEHRQVLSGESWDQGQVVLSWQDTLNGLHAPDDGHNVVIHEFAHQLDQEKGSATGVPILQSAHHYHRWSKVFSAAYLRLQQDAERDLPSLFNHYGATNPAEFFAVASEVFFEKPAALQQEYPELYQELAQFFRLNPLSWQ